MTLFANSILRYYEHIYGYENKTETACVDRAESESNKKNTKVKEKAK